MKKATLLASLFVLSLSCRVTAQPCECKWPVDVIIMQVNKDILSTRSLPALADSLRKSCRYLFFISSDAACSDTIPYVLLKAGKGNRIAVLGSDRLRSDGTVLDTKRKLTTLAGIDDLKKHHRLVAVTRETLNRDKRLEQAMPKFDFIVSKTFIRFDRGKIIFIKEL